MMNVELEERRDVNVPPIREPFLSQTETSKGVELLREASSERILLSLTVDASP